MAIIKREGNFIRKFKSEVLETGVKWFKDRASQKDLIEINRIINARIAEGWTFVTHSYMTNAFSIRSTILLTFKKEK